MPWGDPDEGCAVIIGRVIGVVALVLALLIPSIGNMPSAMANNQLRSGQTASVCDPVNNGCAFMRSTIVVASSSGFTSGYTDVWCTLNNNPVACQAIQGMQVNIYTQGVVAPGNMHRRNTGADCLNNCPTGTRSLRVDGAWQLSYIKIGSTTWYGDGSARVYTRVFTPGGRLVLKGDGTTAPNGVAWASSSGWVNA